MLESERRRRAGAEPAVGTLPERRDTGNERKKKETRLVGPIARGVGVAFFSLHGQQ